jgi:inner membrane protein involved in colicin E2 resistance
VQGLHTLLLLLLLLLLLVDRVLLTIWHERQGLSRAVSLQVLGSWPSPRKKAGSSGACSITWQQQQQQHGKPWLELARHCSLDCMPHACDNSTMPITATISPYQHLMRFTICDVQL